MVDRRLSDPEQIADYLSAILIRGGGMFARRTTGSGAVLRARVARIQVSADVEIPVHVAHLDHFVCFTVKEVYDSAVRCR